MNNIEEDPWGVSLDTDTSNNDFNINLPKRIDRERVFSLYKKYLNDVGDYSEKELNSNESLNNNLDDSINGFDIIKWGSQETAVYFISEGFFLESINLEKWSITGERLIYEPLSELLYKIYGNSKSESNNIIQFSNFIKKLRIHYKKSLARIQSEHFFNIDKDKMSKLNSKIEIEEEEVKDIPKTKSSKICIIDEKTCFGCMPIELFKSNSFKKGIMELSKESQMKHNIISEEENELEFIFVKETDEMALEILYSSLICAPDSDYRLSLFLVTEGSSLLAKSLLKLQDNVKVCLIIPPQGSLFECIQACELCINLFHIMVLDDVTNSNKVSAQTKVYSTSSYGSLWESILSVCSDTIPLSQEEIETRTMTKFPKDYKILKSLSLNEISSSWKIPSILKKDTDTFASHLSCMVDFGLIKTDKNGLIMSNIRKIKISKTGENHLDIFSPIVSSFLRLYRQHNYILENDESISIPLLGWQIRDIMPFWHSVFNGITLNEFLYQAQKAKIISISGFSCELDQNENMMNPSIPSNISNEQIFAFKLHFKVKRSSMRGTITDLAKKLKNSGPTKIRELDIDDILLLIRNEVAEGNLLHYEGIILVPHK